MWATETASEGHLGNTETEEAELTAPKPNERNHENTEEKNIFLAACWGWCWSLARESGWSGSAGAGTTGEKLVGKLCRRSQNLSEREGGRAGGGASFL